MLRLTSVTNGAGVGLGVGPGVGLFVLGLLVVGLMLGSDDCDTVG